jgi:hypothetical protein
MAMRRSFLIASLLLVPLTLGPSLAHLLELPNKLALDREAYLTVQQIYRGWALLGFVVFAALVATGGFAWSSRAAPWRRSAWGAFLCVVATQAVFWTFTAPANQATSNWTVLLPDGWEALRTRWEVSHAVGAGLNLASLGFLLRATERMLIHVGGQASPWWR